MRKDAGVVGKIIVIWLLVVAVIGLVVLDGGSIVFTHFRLSDTGASAAQAGAQAWSDGHDPQAACAAALKSVQQDDSGATLSKGWCKVNPKTGEVTITLRKRAKTMLAWRLGFTDKYTKVVVVETGSPSQL
ncbi:MAG TPA: pilus assembly protein TadG-related protein [Actinomycetota bacterium]|nr:pilus assembly protein TadG-related protein [Actinomycetota bacterium]